MKRRVFTKTILSKGLAEKLLRKGHKLIEVKFNDQTNREIYLFEADKNFFEDLDYFVEEFKKIKYRG